MTMVGTLPPLKGNAYYCMSLAREMSQKIEVDFIAFKKLYPEFLYPGGVSDEDQEFQISETPTLSIRRIITYYNPLTWIRVGLVVRGGIVHIQWWSIPVAPIYLVLLLILKLRRKKIIFTVHNVIPHESSPIDKLLTKAVLSFGDEFIIHSEANRDGFLKHFKIPTRAVHVVHMPVHDMYDDKDFAKEQVRTEIGVPSDAKAILSFGNLREYKGIDHLIAALPAIVEDVPTAHLLIVGQPWVKWDRYERLIKELDLCKSVSIVLKYVPMSEVKKYFVASDLVVLPYKKFDAQSGVGNVALAFGLPIVVSRVGGLPELVQDDRAIVEPDDVSSLATAIKNIFLDDELYRKLCDDTEFLAGKYSWESAIESTLFVYKKCL